MNDTANLSSRNAMMNGLGKQDDGDLSRRLLESASLADELNLEIEYAPDELARPVDHQLLMSLVRGELAEKSTREVTRLIATYRPWQAAWRTALTQEGRPLNQNIPGTQEKKTQKDSHHT